MMAMFEKPSGVRLSRHLTTDEQAQAITLYAAISDRIIATTAMEVQGSDGGRHGGMSMGYVSVWLWIRYSRVVVLAY